MRDRFLFITLLPCVLFAKGGGVCHTDRVEQYCDTVASGVGIRQLDELSVVAKSKSRQAAEGAFTVSSFDVAPDLNRMKTLNDMVGRTAGVRLRREGGAGSDYEFIINGLSGNSIRYFIDGVPLETRGSSASLENIPVSMIERVELYKGVVPSYLASDALGGAVNIVTRRKRDDFLDASLAVGSFHTFQADLSGQWHIPSTAVTIRPAVGINHSRNDYMMRGVEVWDDQAEEYVLADKRRFHDDYSSMFLQIEGGVDNVVWADRFAISVGYDKVDKDIQTGAMHNKVYGMARRHSWSTYVAGRYAKRFGDVASRLNISHTWDHSETVDTAFRKYSWDGTWLPSSGNEMTGGARSIRLYRRPLTVLEAGLDYMIDSHNTASLSYTLNSRGNRRRDEVDMTFGPTNDHVTKQIISIGLFQKYFDDRLNTAFFFKDYINYLSREAAVTEAGKKENTGRRSVANHVGGGAGVRYSFFPALALKGSYEHSVRLPNSRELLGNGTTVLPNLDLSPESGNNYNLGLFGSVSAGLGHLFNYEAGCFIRRVQNYIRATVSEREGMMRYVNEPAIDVKGFDFEMTYLWLDRVQVTVNGSWSEARDMKRFKTDGNPSATYRNRVPNRPWLFGNAEAAYSFRSLILPADILRVKAECQYVHWYYLNWEAYGSASSKARIPTQVVMNLSLSYSWHDSRYNISLGCDNLFDRVCYDNYMLQKPGRSLTAKFRIFLR